VYRLQQRLPLVVMTGQMYIKKAVL